MKATVSLNGEEGVDVELNDDGTFVGMPKPEELIEANIVGKDGWLGWRKKHEDIRVGLPLNLRVSGHVTQVGIRETEKGDVKFIRIRADIIEESDE